MRKLLLLFLGIIFIPLTMYAGPAMPGLIKDKQPDGTPVEYYLRGDEKINWMESPDGHTLLLDNNNRIVYAVLNSQGDMEPSTVVYSGTSLKRSTDSQVNFIPKKLFYSTSQVNSMLDIWKIEEQQIRSKSLGYRPYQGEFRVLCVLVDFPDKPMITQDAKAKFEMLLNQRGYLGTLGNRAYGSVKDYFLENSYGKVNVTFDVIGPYRADSTHKYRSNSAYKVMNIGGLGKFLIDNKIPNEPGLDLSLYADPSGEINRLHIIFAGEDQGGAGLINGFAWAHQSTLGASGSLDPWTRYECANPKDGQIYSFRRYSCSAELIKNARNQSEKYVSTIGTPAHELAHLLFNSDDYYDTSNIYKGTGLWDLMAAGSYSYITDNYYSSIIFGNCPPHMNMYEKIRLGWVKPQILTTPGIISLENSAENPVAYIYQKGSNLTSFTSVDDIEGDYFIIENKQKKGFDAGLLNEAEYNGPLFQGGLLVYRAHKNLKYNSGTNSSYPQKLYPVCASSEYPLPGPIEGGNIVTSYGNISTIGCVFGNAYNSFTDESTPSARTILEYGTGSNVTTSTETGKPLTNIINQNGIVTFRFGDSAEGKYHEDDKEGLRQFIRQGSNVDRAFKYSSVSDTLTWYESEDWIDKINLFDNLSWNNEIPKRVDTIYIGMALDPTTEGVLDCRYFAKLEGLAISSINISKVIASNLLYLKEVHCTDLPLSLLNLSGCTSISKLECYENDLKFSTLPDPVLIQEKYSYRPQHIIDGGIVKVGEIIDLSSEYNIKGNFTTYTWYNKNNEKITLDSPENGKFVASPKAGSSALTCKMTNTTFPDLTLEYTVKVTNIYHEDDKEGLRAFLKENKNLEACNLVPSDTLNWNMLEEWVDKFNTNSGIYVEWSNEVPKRLIGLNLKYMGNKITGSIRFAKFEKLESLDFSFGTTLASYNVTNCENLKTLICSNNFYMSSLNVAGCPNLEYLECSLGKIDNLDLSGCPKLKYLSCSINYLTDLDLSNCPDLEYLACGTNLMTKLNASVCPKLKYLECERLTNFANHEGSTKLTDLDISACVDLESLLCGNNDLTNLNIYARNNLKRLSCANNKLTELDVSNYSKLNDLSCEGNQLKELDLAGCSNLLHFSCQNNQLKSLNNIADCINLLDLWCSNNQLSQLDVSASLNILQLDCSFNQLAELKVPQRLDWKELHCNNNYLKFSTLPLPFSSSSWYSYSPQQAIDGENTPSDQIIDLSSEYNINGNITKYEWREVTGTPVSVKSLGNGRFIAENYAGHHLECVMTNATFPDLILYYKVLVTPGTEAIELKDHLKVKLDNNHLVSKGQTFQIYANINSTNLDGVYFGLYNPINGDLRDSLIVISRTNNVYTCQLRSQTPNSAYMLMPYVYKKGERIDIERPASSAWIDKLPLKVDEDIWGRAVSSYIPSTDVNANKYIQLNINNKVNELFAIDQFVPFKVYMPTTAPTAARIGLFYPNGAFYMDITASRSTYTYTCEITDEVQEGDYIIMPYIKEAGKVQVIERTPNSKLMDRLPIKVNAVDIWGDDIWGSSAFRTAPLNVEDRAAKVLVSLENLSDILTVNASSEIIKTEIYNIQGILMKKVDRESRFSVNNLSAGVYIVKVATSKGITTHKIKKD